MNTPERRDLVYLAKMPSEMTPEELEVFAAECRRESLRLRDDPHEKEIMDWLEAVFDEGDWSDWT